ncbi:hypothetical protein [Pseudoduganella sp. OTU4001]|uniref:hypothetical protein n=1 Tax=Pseudoduganella sp. OTU4001 TaxID=3043854 RepID=UPI00313CA87D
MELYRSHEICCVVDQAKRGKTSARRHCFLTIQHIDERLPRYYRVDVIAWTAQAARTLGLQYAKEHLDAALAQRPPGGQPEPGGNPYGMPINGAENDI